MALNLNQFKLSNIPGLVMNTGANVIEAQVATAYGTATAMVAGQVVSLATQAYANEVVVVTSIAGCGIGVILFNEKINQYTANMTIGLALDGTIINMYASSPTARGTIVGYGTNGVAPISSGTGIGIAFDAASNAGDIIRVMIKAGVSATINF